MKKIMWIVQFTNYEDSPRKPEDRMVFDDHPYLFKTQKTAQTYLNSQIVDEINDRLQETPMECIPEDCREFFQSDEDGIFISEEFCNSFEILDMLHKKLMKGSYVNYVFDWRLSEVQIDHI